MLHGIDLDIPRGDFVALMGPSGSGKTTLLNLIGGLDTPDRRAASRWTAGASTSSRAASSRAWRAANVGFVFQFYNLLPVLSAQRNVELPLLLTDLSAPRSAAGTPRIALTLVGLEDRARHKPRELSGGQEQRVAIARAIVSDPTLLVCDEPTGDLDRATADEVLTPAPDAQPRARQDGRDGHPRSQGRRVRAAARCTWTRARWPPSRSRA